MRREDEKTGLQEKKWDESGKKGKKPKIVHKEVYTCKRRMPQPLFDKPTIYQDPFKKEITQFCTERNDGWINGGCKFSMLLNLNNVDDKIIVEEWLMKVPKVKWLESKKKVQVLTSKTKGGQLPEEYSAKYVTKGIPTRGVKGDILLACVQRMEPENEVNMGTFTKINNFVNKRGNIPIFNAVHGNLKLPLVFQNFNIKECSVLGLSQVKNKNLIEQEQCEAESEYIIPGLIDKFNRRLDQVVRYSKLVLERTK